jgi:hypothetical protein
MNVAPTRRRIADNTSNVNFMRLSSDPPYGGSRVFVSGDQNWSIKCP